MRKKLLLCSFILVIVAGLDSFVTFYNYGSAAYLFEHPTNPYAETVWSVIQDDSDIRKAWKLIEESNIRVKYCLILALLSFISSLVWHKIDDIAKQETNN